MHQVSRVCAQAQDDDAARRKRGAAAAAHAQLRAAGGDSLSALNALCAFERSGRSEAFCRCAACSFLFMLLGYATQRGWSAVCASCAQNVWASTRMWRSSLRISHNRAQG